ncbi:hypothetical protein QUF80_11160 [Desulfococcaceae bacterium HSG8]|nr:hypothetical protein [Desulfococcaceae bacterium HSG8]
MPEIKVEFIGNLMSSGKKHTRSKFVVPPSGGVMPPEGGTANCLLVYSFPEIT